MERLKRHYWWALMVLLAFPLGQKGGAEAGLALLMLVIALLALVRDFLKDLKLLGYSSSPAEGVPPLDESDRHYRKTATAVRVVALIAIILLAAQITQSLLS